MSQTGNKPSWPGLQIFLYGCPPTNDAWYCRSCGRWPQQKSLAEYGHFISHVRQGLHSQVLKEKQRSEQALSKISELLVRHCYYEIGCISPQKRTLGSGVRCNVASMRARFFLGHVKPYFNKMKNWARQEFSEKPSRSIYIDSRRVANSLEIPSKPYDRCLFLFAEHPVFHLGRDTLVYILYLQYDVLVLSLRFLNQTVRVVDNGPLIPVIFGF